MEEDPEFTEDFKRVFNNSDITEADDFTLEVLKNKPVDMELSLLRD